MSRYLEVLKKVAELYRGGKFDVVAAYAGRWAIEELLNDFRTYLEGHALSSSTVRSYVCLLRTYLIGRDVGAGSESKLRTALATLNEFLRSKGIENPSDLVETVADALADYFA
ncbi:MAG: hypothetical protein DRJ40_09610 [Thermoprotei archaeon]|nr:MAG: hypothetical protein DRJ40_09610 [Thermoprotei archaeon]